MNTRDVYCLNTFNISGLKFGAIYQGIIYASEVCNAEGLFDMSRGFATQ